MFHSDKQHHQGEVFLLFFIIQHKYAFFNTLFALSQALGKICIFVCNNYVVYLMMTLMVAKHVVQ